MEKACIKSYLDLIDDLDNRDFLLNYIKYNIAATLKGIKPSYLMVFHKNQTRDFYTGWKNYRTYIASSLDIEFLELKEDGKSIHVLFYRKSALKKTLRRRSNREFLSRFGYNKLDDLGQTLELLAKRYEISCPHEIGVFLGYPVDDVVHFIYPSKKECLLSGYWKVFTDRQGAEETFKAYDQCRIDVLKDLGS